MHMSLSQLEAFNMVEEIGLDYPFTEQQQKVEVNRKCLKFAIGSVCGCQWYVDQNESEMIEALHNLDSFIIEAYWSILPLFGSKCSWAAVKF